jgi:hypothetical protein
MLSPSESTNLLWILINLECALQQSSGRVPAEFLQSYSRVPAEFLQSSVSVLASSGRVLASSAIVQALAT